MMNFETKTNLLPHQPAPVEKMLPTRVGALFMDMGTGKSRTGIEVVHRRQHRISKVIWFCPVSLKHTIRREILKHTACRPEHIYCFDHKTTSTNYPRAQWYIVGIESMSLSSRVILAIARLVDTRTCVIVDESDLIKGHRSKRTCWITDLSEKARYRMVMTGTPISQGVQDLYAQFRFLSPKILGYSSWYSFSANHLEYSDRFPGKIVRAHNTEWIAAKIQPYVYQVTKDECFDLPKKLYSTRYFRMTELQREYYDRIKWETLDMIEDWNSYAIFQLFSKLQQIVCGFLNTYNLEFDHNRIDTLLDIVYRIPDHEPVVIWCKYEHDVHQITEAMGPGDVAQFYGQTSPAGRERSINGFGQEKRFFLATEGCGGRGLNDLIGTAYNVFYSNSFKYAPRMHAEDRTHRYGAERPVTYVDIVCEDSIDERIMSAHANKDSVVESFRREVVKVRGDKRRMKQLFKRL